MGFDTVVVGAGVAGLSAAVTAARHGLKTALIEKNSRVGGSARDCFHTHMGGLFENDPTCPFKVANPGICEALYSYFFHRYGERCLVKMGKVEVLAIDGNELWRLFTDWLQASGVTVLLNTTCTDITTSQFTNISAVTTSTEDVSDKTRGLNATESSKISDSSEGIGSPKVTGSSEAAHPLSLTDSIDANAFIDTTGNAVLSAICSKDAVVELDQRQLGGYCIQLEGGFSEDLTIKIPYVVRKITEAERLSRYLGFVSVSSSPFDTTWVIKFSLLNEDEIAVCDLLFRKLQNEFPQIATAQVLARSERINYRDGMLPKGMAAAEYVERDDRPDISKFHSPQQNRDTSQRNRDVSQLNWDASCRDREVKGFWPAEFWDVHQGPQFEYCHGRSYFRVRPSALTSAVMRNLFFGGRSINASANAQASLRVMGTCIATGESAAHCAVQYLKTQT